MGVECGRQRGCKRQKQQKTREESHKSPVRFPGHSQPSHPLHREEKAVDHTQASCSGCIKQMAERRGGGGGRRGVGFVFLCCLLTDTVSDRSMRTQENTQMNSAVFYRFLARLMKASRTTSMKSSNHVCVRVCFVLRVTYHGLLQTHTSQNYTRAPVQAVRRVSWRMSRFKATDLFYTHRHTRRCWD